MFDRRAPIALVLACLVLAGGAVGFRVAARALDVYLRKEPVELRRHFDNMPERLDGWVSVGKFDKLGAEMVEALGTDVYLDRRYVMVIDGEKNPDEWVLLHLAYYTGMIDPVPHVPDRCMVAGGFNADTLPRNIPMDLDREGWRIDDGPPNRATGEPYRVVDRRDPVTGRTSEVRLPVGDFALRTTEFSDDDQPGTRIFAGYFFIANGRVAVTPGQVKELAFRPSERTAYYCKVQVLAQGDRGLDETTFVERSEAFLSDLLPELMHCLPDWAEVEAAEREGDDA